MSLIGRCRKWAAERAALARYCEVNNVPARWYDTNRRRRERIERAFNYWMTRKP